MLIYFKGAKLHAISITEINTYDVVNAVVVSMTDEFRVRQQLKDYWYC